MDQALLPKIEEQRWELTWESFVEELRRVSCIAAPLMVVSMTVYLLQVVSMMMAGHLSELSLAGVSMATSFTNVTGFSLLIAFGVNIMFLLLFLMTLLIFGVNTRLARNELSDRSVGFSGGLETLCGQTYGAEQYKKFGSYTYCAIISLVVVSIPLSVLWIFMDRLLIALGIDSEISVVAREYAIWLIPALFAFAIMQPLFRYFQTQSIVLPILISTCAALCFHVPLCWALVYKWELGSNGGALAIGASYWLNVILLVLYMVFSSSCERTRGLYWNDIFSCIRKFFRFAIPSAVMVCLEWWTYEVVILLAGLLPSPKLQTSVLSICLSITTLHYYVQYGIGAAGRIANELGAGNPKAAQGAVQVVLIMSLVEVVTVSLILFFCRHIFGYAFSNDKGVVEYVAELAPLMCLCLITEGLQAILSGIARGCGWQHIGAYINLGAFYLVATPLAVFLCFSLDLRSKGLLMGLLIGKTVQSTTYSTITALTNWQKQAAKARERLLEGSFLAHSGLA